MRIPFSRAICVLALSMSSRPAAGQPPPSALAGGSPPSAPVAAAAPEPGDAPPIAIDRPAPATGSVRGVVRGADGEPVAGATISHQGSGGAAIAGADGAFLLEGIPAGRQALVVEAAGRGSAVVTVEVQAGAVAAVDATLGEVTAVGEEIVVTGLRAPEKRLDSPVNVEIVSEKDIQRAAGAGYLSALAGVKGLDFASAGIGDQRISARGFTTQFNSRMLTMLDGRLAQLPGNGLPQGNLLPATGLDMKMIEVVVGPASALYGPNAHTGVVNVITKTPWDQSGAALVVRGGSQDMLSGAARLAGTVTGDLGWKVNAEMMRAEDFAPSRTRSIRGDDGIRRTPHFYGTDVAPPGGMAVPVFEGDLVGGYDLESAKADGSVYYRFGEDWQAVASYGFSRNDGFALTNAGRNHIRGWEVQHQAIQLSGGGLFAQVTRTASDAGRTYPINNLAPLVASMGGTEALGEAELEELRRSIRFVDKSQMVDSDVQYHRAFGGLKATVGGQVRSYMPESQGSYLSDADQSIQATELGAYAQLDHVFLADRLRLVGAARVDHHSDYATQLSPSATAVYAVAPGHNVRAGYQRAFKSPTILENHLLINGILVGNRTGFEIRDADGGVVATIDPLEPERVNSVELGYKGVFGTRLFVEGVIYNSWYRNFISPLTQQANPNAMDPATATFGYYPDGTIVGEGSAAPGTLFTYVNFGEATVRGIDVGATFLPIDGLELSGSGSFIDLADFSSGESPQRELLLNVPSLKLKGAVTVAGLGLPDAFLRLSARYHNAYDFESGYWSSSRFGKVPAGVVADIGAGYELRGTGMSLSATVANLFGSRDPDVLGVPVPGRLAYVELGYRWGGLDY